MSRQAKSNADQWNGESVRRSIDLYAVLFEKYRSLGDLSEAAKTLTETAHLYVLLENYEVAALKLNEALNISKKIGDNKLRAEVLGLLSMVYLRNGKIVESEKFLKQAFEINLPDDAKIAKAIVYSAAAEFKYVQRELDETKKNCFLAIDLWREIGDPKQEIWMLRLLAYALAADDDVKDSLELLDLALEKARQNNLRREEALSQYQMGLNYFIFNEPQTALEICRQAETLFPDDMEFIEKARLLNGIGSIYEIYADWKTALTYKQKALSLFERVDYQIGRMATLPSLVNLSFQIGDENSAFDYYKQAEILSKKLGDSFYMGNAKLYAADFYAENGQEDRAIELYLESRSALEKMRYANGVTLVENNLGKLYTSQKKFEAAEQYLNSSLERNRKNRNKFAESETLFNLAKLRRQQNNNVEALKFAAESVEITENLSTKLVNAKLKTAYFSDVFERYEFYINLLMTMNSEFPAENYAERAFEISERSRARRMLENLLLSESDFIKDAPVELVEREKEIRNLLNLKTDKLSDLINFNSEKEEITETESEVFALKTELEELNARLKQTSPIYSAVKNPAALQIAEFQNKILDENTVLLEFSLGERESYLWMIGKNDFSAYRLPPREQIESKVRQLRELLAENEKRANESIEDYQQRIAEVEKKYDQTAQNLSRELFGQTAGKLKGKRLILVVDGYLHYFPLSALHLPDSTGVEPILLTNETVNEPSALLLLTQRQNSAKKTKAAADVLIFADPVFSADDSRLTKNDAENTSVRFRFTDSLDSLSRLIASKDESDSILSIVGNTNSDGFSGFDATREKLLETDVSVYKVLHFATHGLINEERPELSGIVLSRFNENGEKLNETIRLQDIYGLNLKNDLVVLSACSTGIGKEIKGEGLMSLNNAFLQSGSKAVISSLWKVDDFATLELMKNFYTEMSEKNVSPSIALRTAKIKLRENPQYESPFYWAAFTFHGDFQNKPDFSRSQSSSWYFIVLFSLLALGLIFVGYGLYWRKSGLIN